VISALLMMRRLAAALRVALRDEDFGRVLTAGLALIVVGTLAYSIGGDWSVVAGLYVAVGTLRHPGRARPQARHGIHGRQG